MESKRKILIITGIAVLATLITIVHGPIPQDPTYHAFADQRLLYGIPNFWNVISNIPIIVAGLAGLLLVATKKYSGGLPSLTMHYALFFAGAVFIGAGSAWYHLHPDNDTLVWDRLPMTLTFMALFSAILGENIAPVAGRLSLWPLLGAGVASVYYWHITELAGHGDLRSYAMIQFLPLLLIPIIMLLFKSPFTSNRILLWLLMVYVLAKIAELYDHEIYHMLNFLSGHTLKHLCAALGIFCYYLALKKRIPRCGGKKSHAVPPPATANGTIL